jgi:FkbM family methyltransferase
MSGSIASARSSVLKQAYSLHQTGKLDDAASLYREILKQNPRDADALHLLGVIEMQKANPLAAIEWIDRAIASRPNDAEFSYNRGNALGTLKRFDDAIASYDRALTIKPDYAAAFYNRGNALRDLKRFEDALASYDHALAIKPDYAEALKNRGVALGALRHFDDALASYDRALLIRPAYAEALNNRGVALGALKRFDDALTSYDRALTIKPDYAEALNNRGVALEDLKRFDDALASYDRALAIKPDYAEALNNRGMVLVALKRFDDALASYDRALAIRPDYADALYNRGHALRNLRRSDEEIASYDGALALRPDYPEALNNRGIALRNLKRFDDALASYDRALALRPYYPEALSNRGNVLRDLKRFEDALASYDLALEFKPDYAEALINRGNALRSLKRFDDALASYDGALALRPDSPEALNNRGVALGDLKRFEDALVSYDRALAIKPDHPEALNNRGAMLVDLKRFEDALASFDCALAIRSDYAEALNNRGVALRYLKRFDDALASFDRALAIRPDYPEALCDRGTLKLLGGFYEEGWPDYEWRWKREDFSSKPPKVNAREWQGEDIGGRSILVFNEQGLGDVIQFARYLPLLIQRGARVSFFVPAKLMRLFRSLGAGIELISSLEVGRSFDFRCALMSLPLHFGTDAESIPNQIPYLKPEEDVACRWKQILGETGFKVGIAWQGNPQGRADLGRSFSLSEIVPLARLPGVRLISLQKDDGLAQLVNLPAGITVETLGDDFDGGPDAFIDTAGVMSSLDLIVTADTSIAHLAGALGCPVWVALKHVPDWRWLLDRQDSPWYPTARLFRQKTAGDWSSVFSTIERELRALLGPGNIHQTTNSETAVVSSGAGPRQPLVRQNPRDADALYLLGIVELQKANPLAAIEWIDRAIAIRPNSAEFFYSRGNALRNLKRFDDALASYDQALTIKPDYAEALNNRGVALGALRHFDDALASYDRALAIRPDYAEAFNNRGVALGALRRFDEALASYDRALTIRPDYPEALNNRGVALEDLKRFDDALASYDRALSFKPDYPEAINNRGLALGALKRFDEAIVSYDRALAIKPAYAEAFYNRGNALRDLKRFEDALASYDHALAIRSDFANAFNNRGFALEDLKRFDDALVSYDRALAITPDYPEALNNRGNALTALKRFDDALASYDRALELKPDYAESRFSRGVLKLLCGHYREGWADYEWRWKKEDFSSKPPEIDARTWQGEDLHARSLLIFSEQGLGDIIQFVRFLHLLVQRGARVSFFGPAKLMRLLRPLSAQIEFLSPLEIRKSFDFKCALMSLPLHFGTDSESIPNQVPYLTAEEGLVHRWKQMIGGSGFKIGIAWQGNPQAKVDQGRSFPLSELAPLSRLPGVRLISLQKHHGLDRLTALPPGTMVETFPDGFDNGSDAFIDTAAIMSNLDLIITSDTSIAHLAGALGRPTWVALKHVPDWRWLLDRQDSPWYPTARLFRQKTAGDWSSVFSTIEQDLRAALGLEHIQRPIGEAGANSDAAQKAAAADRRPLLEGANLRLKRCKHGAMMFYGNDEFIGRSLDLYGEFSEGEMELFHAYLRPGMTVVDVGANIGVHTVYFANAVGPSGHVLAFEPQRILYQILCGNVALNQHTNVVALNAGLGTQSGTILVPRVDYARRGNFGGLSLGKSEKGDEVPLRTLDSCSLNACHLIKIDVEGMELAVLEGAVAVLDEHKPLLYVENDRAENSKALIAWLLNRDYRLYWHVPPMFNAKNYFGESQNVFGKIVSINMLCIPRAMAASVSGLREITSPDADWRTPGKPTG